MAETDEIKGWVAGRVPQEWYEGAPEVTIDREEILVVGTLKQTAAAKDDKPKKATPATTQAAKAINKFCAVEQDNPIDPKVPTYTYNGKVIGFCCEDCLPTFKKNPEKYMKTLK